MTAANALFGQLRAACAEDWRAYCEHAFVRQLGAGTLPEASFRHYLGQDYLFLIHFARAYALAIYKADNLADMRAAAATVSGLLDVEMSLHVKYCAGWGMTEAEMEKLPEATATMAYTRYVLERGLSGDALDLAVALAADPATKKDGNPYAEWIDMYAGDEYQEVARAAVDQLDRLADARLTPARLESLKTTFAQATRLEASFWDMGLNLST